MWRGQRGPVVAGRLDGGDWQLAFGWSARGWVRGPVSICVSRSWMVVIHDLMFSYDVRVPEPARSSQRHGWCCCRSVALFAVIRWARARVWRRSATAGRLGGVDALGLSRRVRRSIAPASALVGLARHDSALFIVIALLATLAAVTREATRRSADKKKIEVRHRRVIQHGGQEACANR